jgi:hypothetical protein
VDPNFDTVPTDLVLATCHNVAATHLINDKVTPPASGLHVRSDKGRLTLKQLIALVFSLLMSVICWAETAPPGTTIPSSHTKPFISIREFRGAWEANHDYPTGSIVSYNGLSYVAERDESTGVVWYSLNGVYPSTTSNSCPKSPLTDATTVTEPYKYTWTNTSFINGVSPSPQSTCTVTGTLSTTGPLKSMWFQVFFPLGWSTGSYNNLEDPFITMTGIPCCGAQAIPNAAGDVTDYVFDVFTTTALDVLTDCYGNYAYGISTQQAYSATGGTPGLINPCGAVTTPHAWVYVRVRAVTANPNHTPFTITFFD